MFVSIVIPHFNNIEGLKKLLEAISKQTFNKNNFEVIVVDNGSAVNLDFLENDRSVRLIFENEHLNSPYSSRNRGIEYAKGDVLAFVDSTCIPQPHWLYEGVNAIKNGGDIVAGDIQFTFPPRFGLGEIYDSIFHVNAAASARKGFVLGGNFFITANIYKDLGLYPEGQRTSGDFIFSHQAIKHGYKLVFCPTAVVNYPARGLNFISRKTWRISRGQPFIWKMEDRFFTQFMKSLVKILPPHPKRIKELARTRFFRRISLIEFVKLYFLRYFMQIVSFTGNVVTIFSINNK